VRKFSFPAPLPLLQTSGKSTVNIYLCVGITIERIICSREQDDKIHVFLILVKDFSKEIRFTGRFSSVKNIGKDRRQMRN